jgi:hypothetical protein
MFIYEALRRFLLENAWHFNIYFCLIVTPLGILGREDIAGSVKVRGRGGAILQPGIDRLLAAEDFPGAASLLVITDGYCEDRPVFRGREHAFLLPAGARLPFVPKGKVFRFR